MLLNCPQLALDTIGDQLPAEDLFRLAMTSKALKEYFNKDTFWEKLMKRKLWVDRKFFRYQDDYLFILNNVPNRLQRATSFNKKVVRFATYSHDGSMIAAFANGCRLWIFRGEEEVLHTYLSRERNWDRILSVDFSPNDEHLLVTGVLDFYRAMSRHNEVLVYKIGDQRATLRSFVSLGRKMLGTWFDNTHFLYMQNDGERDRMRIFISSIDMADEILVYPILTFDTRVTKIAVAQHVSPRTRRITQIADQAQEEGKSLMQKLIEIGMESGVDVTNMAELRAILDQETQCMPCYRLHSHHDAVTPAMCACQCHHNTDKLLIFHGNDDRVHVKVITEAVLERAREVHRRRSQPDGGPDRNRLLFAIVNCTVFDTVDHVFKIGSSLVENSMCLSPDNKYLYLTGIIRVRTGDISHLEVKPTCLDLDTMTIKNLPDFCTMLWTDSGCSIRITANNDFVAITSSKSVQIWSTHHRGKVVEVLDHNDRATCVALHPFSNLMCVTNERVVHYYQSPLMAREENKKLKNQEGHSSLI